MPAPLLSSATFQRVGGLRRKSRVEGARIQAFRELYEANFSAVLGFVLRRAASPDDAADVVAETFLTVWRRLDDVPPGEQARPWLYGVARRVLANHRRGEARRANLAERLREDLTRLDVRPWAESVEPGPVVAAFNALGRADREVLALVAWEELRPVELAGVLGCSPNAAKIRLHRARRRLERELGRLDPSRTTQLPTAGQVALARGTTGAREER